jgi:glycosyltransferase involved in cell wall biosynthesis
MIYQNAAFAIPGDINTLTGGYIYERLLLENLRAIGHDVTHVQLGAGFPDPSPAEMAHAVDTLIALDPSRALILDGLVYGSIDTNGLAKVRAPIVAMIHHPLAKETGLSRAAQDHLFKTERDNLALAQAVLVPSPHTAQILTSEYGVNADRIHIAQPGTEQAGEMRVPKDPPLILTVGILHPRKGHDVLVRALADLKSIAWRSVIAGSSHDADYARDLQDMITDLGLTGRITLAGNIPRRDLHAMYKEASLFALATRYEGYGMVFNEALTWGLPIVSCAAGAVPQTVPQDAGILVPVDAVGHLSDAIRRLLIDQEYRATMETASLKAGQALPGWGDTARVASTVLNGLTE